MAGDLASTIRIMAAIACARDGLLSFAGDIWSLGSYEHFLAGRKSRFATTEVSDVECGMLLGETIELDEARTLDMDINIHFRLPDITLSGGILVSIEMPEGFEEEEILELPRVSVESADEFTSTLADFVARICAHRDVLVGVAARRP